jgi:amino acid adenylation domain-containing protein
MEDRPPAAARFDPAVCPLPLASDLVAGAAALAEAEGTSTASVLRACWTALIARLTGETAITVGEVDPGRRQEGLAGALGLFEAPFPGTHRAGAGLSFREALRLVDASLEESLPWRDYAAAEAAGEPRDAPLGFAEEEDMEPRNAGGVSFTVADRFHCTTRFGLQLVCRRSPAGATGELRFDAGRIRPESAARLAGHFGVLLRGAVEDPDSPVDRLALLEAGQARRLIVDFNARVPRRPAPRSVNERFEEQARKTPNAVAVVFDRDRWTYGELNARANRLGRFLRSRGLDRGAPVGLCLERSAGMIEGLLGILKAGGAYVPLNPEHPDRRLAGQLRESGAPVLVTEERLASRFADFPGLVVRLDRDRPLLESQPATDPGHVPAPDELVSVIYTSGSTGTPKGVATPHGALANYVAAIADALGLREDSPPLHFASVTAISADLGNTSIFPALVSGGTLHLIPYEVATDASRFAEYMRRHPIDVLKIVPSHFRALTGSPPRAESIPRRFLVLGGEALDLDLAKGIAGRSACVVYNHYGPTETTVGSLVYRVGEDSIDPGSATVPIGRPLANTDVYILDRGGRAAPVGIPGELYIGGAGLARGYLARPAETAERFVPHPFATDPGRRLYRTGDVARYLPDGNVEFLGRSDDQLKIRGFRIEPREVQAALDQHPGVRESFVLASEAGAGEKRLIAYVVPAGESEPSRDALRRFLFELLPDYMVPSAFVVLGALPLTRNGKVDRAALPAAPETPPETEKAFVAPRTPTEEKLAGIWSEVLGVERVGVLDNFFDLGGHSLKATQVIARLRTTFRVAMPLKSLFESPTIEGLAIAITGNQAEGVGGDDVGRLLAEMEGLSEEEAQRLLSARSPGGDA